MISGVLDVTVPALRALARGVQSPSVLKDKTAIQTTGRLQDKTKGWTDTLLNMDQVLQDLFDRNVHFS